MDAVYKPTQDKKGQGNPLVEALHFLNESEFQANAVSGCTDWCPENFWQLPKIVQLTSVMSMNRIHVPTKQLKQLYEKIVTNLLDVYSSRSPFTANSNRLKYALAVAIQERKVVQRNTMTNAPSMLVYGHSGAGKTTGILAILNVIPQVIVHREYAGKPYQQLQLVWISIDLPATPSIKALALSFFCAVDNALGTDYYDKWSRRNRDSVDQHITGMQLVAQTHELGLIHIDEMQFMLGYAQSKEKPSMVVLEAIFNKLGIPMLLSTTTAGLELFRADYSANGCADFTITRRMLSDRKIEFLPVQKGTEEFTRFINAMFPEQLLLNCTELSPEFIDQFHYLSCGLPAIMSRLARQHHEFLIQLVEKKGQALMRTDDVKLLLSVYKNQFTLIDDALGSLRRGLVSEFEAQVSGTAIQRPARSKSKLTAKETNVVANDMFPPIKGDHAESAVTSPLKTGEI
ncbi:MAG: TniB family NTP-binding protein [Gammaproteobacteria bacterium]|nr:TniB family NTP-binding protein [Gammaproteobacteria bacterium]